MSYRVELARSARTYLDRLDRPTQERIGRLIDQLMEDPHTASKPLTGPGRRRSARVGRYRVIFTVDSGDIVNISRIGSRGQVYRGL